MLHKTSTPSSPAPRLWPASWLEYSTRFPEHGESWFCDLLADDVPCILCCPCVQG